MDKVQKIDSVNPADLKKTGVFNAKNKYLDQKNIDPDFKEQKQQRSFLKKTLKNTAADSSDLSEKINVDIRGILIALENALKHYNDILDSRKINLYIFYDLTKDNNIIINIADIKKNEYIYKHTICIDCIKTENDFMQIIGDFIRDRGILLDLKA